MGECIDHLNFVGGVCEDCGLPVDQYGNTEDQFDYCCYPDCGCDGSRLCMAGEASPDALDSNVEGMWRGNTKEQRKGRMRLAGLIFRQQKDGKS